MKFIENVDYDEMFGNDSGEDEQDKTLKEYFVNLPNFRNFFETQLCATDLILSFFESSGPGE